MVVREFAEEDVRILYQLYRLGKITFFRDGLKPNDFKLAILAYIKNNYTHGWTVGNGGIVFALDTGPVLLLKDVFWYPKANLRTKIKSAVSFFTYIRDWSICVLYAQFMDKSFFEHCVDYRLLRRVGTIYGAVLLSEFQTR